MTDFVLDVIADQCIKALGDFMRPFLRGGEVVRGQVNRVPQPADRHCILTEGPLRGLGRVVTDYPSTPDTQQAVITGPTQLEVQADFYGDIAGDMCEAFRNAFMSEWAFSQFPDTVKPLFCTEGIQAPLVTGEQQYQNRYVSTVSLQYNPAVTVPQQSATTAQLAALVAVDVEYIEGVIP